MRFDNSYFSERIHCTDNEKTECLDTVREMVRAYETVHKNGVLALADFVSDDPFLNECKEYLTSGFWHEIPKIYETLILVGNYHGKEFLQNIIIAKGLIAITEENAQYPLIKVIPPLFGISWGNKITELIYDERTKFINEMRKAYTASS